MRNAFLLLLAASLCGCGESETPIKISANRPITSTETAALAKKEPLRLAIAAVISPAASFKYYEEMIDYLGDKASQPIRLVQRETYREINDLMKLGKIDIAFVCSGAYVDGQTEFGMELLAAPQINGKTVYYSYIIAAASSEIHNLKGLKTRTFAFTDPLSNSGCLSPTYVLKKEMSESPDTFFREVKFTYSHDSSIKAVAQGKVDGAAVDSLVYEYLKKTEPELVAKTRVIHISSPYGIPPVVVHPKVNPELKRLLRDIFLNMHQDSPGKEILERLMIDKFVAVEDDLFDSIREAKKILR